MLELIELKIFTGSVYLISLLYEATFYYGSYISLIAGLLLPIIYFDKPNKGEEDSPLRRVLVIVALLLFVLGTLAPFTVPPLVKYVQSMRMENVTSVYYPTSSYLNMLVCLVASIIHTVVRRELTTIANQLKKKATKKTTMARDERTDVRTIKEMLPQTVEYDPEDYIDLTKGVFVGLDREQKPQYIPLESMRKMHADIIGTTGAGKGVVSGLILYQLILADEGTFVLDPKNDEWAPHLLKYACEKAGKPFFLIDLNKKAPQLDLLAGASSEQIEELLVAGFSLAEKGDTADFYRIDDRKAARKAPQLADDEQRRSFEGLFSTEYVQGLQDTIKAFYGKLEEISLIESVNAIGGLNLNDIYEQGGCCYIIGSLRNSKILMTQKMILIRLLQLAEMRDRINGSPRPIAIFLDELKYHISKPAMEGLGAARDKGVHMLLAHQSIADLKDCPADLNGDAVVGAVVENTKLKIVYRLQDPKTAQWVAEMSGTILVDDETRYVESGRSLTETIEDRRNIKLAERELVDSNMLLNLPNFVSYIFTPDFVPKPSLIAPIKVKKQPLETFDQTLAVVSQTHAVIDEQPIHLDDEALIDTHDEVEAQATASGDNDSNQAPIDLDEDVAALFHIVENEQAQESDENDTPARAEPESSEPVEPFFDQAMLDILEAEIEGLTEDEIA
ncbi:type IV secretory system conjugative DNA transfer family protein [Vibrio sp. WXL103]|uniref:type IV secretory system conjugative DNA transfer family protein n=1 Tax=Vibrio sp. WXL103 TaxID=3450710 RepID=UPI003EC6201E